jgi:RNA polymerase sigma-70 factor, ECF subfamily
MIDVQYNSAIPLAARSRTEPRKVASDEILIERIALGDQHAMRALFVRHNVRVFRFLLRLVRDRALAEDLANATFLEVWRNAHQFRSGSRLSTWLLAIARYQAISEMKRRKSHVELDEALEVADLSDDPEVAAQTRNRDDLIRACLTKLSPSHREIIDLVYYHEQPVASVGKIVGIPVSTVKTRMFYARKQLAELLAKEGIDGTALVTH